MCPAALRRKLSGHRALTKASAMPLSLCQANSLQSESHLAVSAVLSLPGHLRQVRGAGADGARLPGAPTGQAVPSDSGAGDRLGGRSILVPAGVGAQGVANRVVSSKTLTTACCRSSDPTTPRLGRVWQPAARAVQPVRGGRHSRVVARCHRRLKQNIKRVSTKTT